MHAPRKTIELCDHQDAADPAGKLGECSREPGTLQGLSRYARVFVPSQDREASLFRVGLDGNALRFEAQSGDRLLIGRHAQVSDDANLLLLILRATHHSILY